MREVRPAAETIQKCLDWAAENQAVKRGHGIADKFGMGNEEHTRKKAMGKLAEAASNYLLKLPTDWEHRAGGKGPDHIFNDRAYDTKMASFNGRPRYLKLNSLEELKGLDGLILSWVSQDMTRIEVLGWVSSERFRSDWIPIVFEERYGEKCCMSEDELEPIETLLGEQVPERARRPAPLVRKGRLVLDFTGGPMKLRLEEM